MLWLVLGGRDAVVHVSHHDDASAASFSPRKCSVSQCTSHENHNVATSCGDAFENRQRSV